MKELSAKSASILRGMVAKRISGIESALQASCEEAEFLRQKLQEQEDSIASSRVLLAEFKSIESAICDGSLGENEHLPVGYSELLSKVAPHG